MRPGTRSVRLLNFVHLTIGKLQEDARGREMGFAILIRIWPSAFQRPAKVELDAPHGFRMSLCLHRLLQPGKQFVSWVRITRGSHSPVCQITHCARLEVKF